MKPIEQQILLYDDLPASEREEVDRYVEAHPEWAPLLAEARGLHTLLGTLPPAGAVPDALDIAQYVLARHLDRHPEATQVGLYPQLAALETLSYPSSRQLEHTDELARSGTLDIAPMESPLPLFIWSKSRVVPIRLTDFSITEEAFDPDLNPIRAKVSLGMRVLSVYDLGFDHRGGALFMTYLRSKERFAAGQASQLGELGLTGLP